MRLLIRIPLLSYIYVSVKSAPSFGTFDYIVVGSGAAGGILASELALKGFKTVLIEAGPDYMSANITTPAFHIRASEDENIAWDYYVQRYNSDKKSDFQLYPKVGGLGGCTLHNAMVHILPTQQDFNQMVELTKDENWSQEHMIEYFNHMQSTILQRFKPFLLAEKISRKFSKVQEAIKYIPFRVKRWLRLSKLNVVNLLAKDTKLLDIVRFVLGKPLVGYLTGYDINYTTTNGSSGLEQEQAFLVPINLDPSKNSQRVGVYERLQQMKNNDKLTIMTDTLATKILLDGNNRAYGIQFIKGNHLFRASKKEGSLLAQPGVVYASKEVIISAGTFNTPQLMMLSGIGDPAELVKQKIPVKVPLLGVGKNLHDRYEVSVNYQYDSNFQLLKGCTFQANPSDPCYAQFQDTQSGPYTFSGILSAILRKSKPSLIEPDLVTLVAPIQFNGYHVGMGQEAADEKNKLSFLILKARTLNRAGTVTLRSRDARDPPNIHFRSFQQGGKSDLLAIISAIRQVRNIMKGFSENATEVLPGPNVDSTLELAQYIKQRAWGHHATGTMKIGNDDDPYAVLDGQFRVRGAKNLRVVDFSIFPDIPGYFPVLYLYMVGYKAADDLAADYDFISEPSSAIPQSSFNPIDPQIQI